MDIVQQIKRYSVDHRFQDLVRSLRSRSDISNRDYSDQDIRSAAKVATYLDSQEAFDEN